METGRRFRDTVLALGGGKSPLEVRGLIACFLQVVMDGICKLRNLYNFIFGWFEFGGIKTNARL